VTRSAPSMMPVCYYSGVVRISTKRMFASDASSSPDVETRLAPDCVLPVFAQPSAAATETTAAPPAIRSDLFCIM
jgi:hypothetical protein